VGKPIHTSRVLRRRLDSSGSLYYRMAYNCVYGKEYLGTLEGNTFIDQLVN